MWICPICEEYTFYSCCNDCRKIRHYMNIYSKNRIIEILDSILSRQIDKQENKITLEICKEIENKEKSLNCKAELMSELKTKLKDKQN